MLKDVSAACLKLSETGLGIKNGHRNPEYWNNPLLTLIGNPAVRILSQIINKYPSPG